jgi:hypothetical protein
VNRCLPGMHPSTARSAPMRCSRLKNMTFGSGLEEEEDLALSYNRLVNFFSHYLSLCSLFLRCKRDFLATWT